MQGKGLIRGFLVLSLTLEVLGQSSTPLDAAGASFEPSSEWRVINLDQVIYGWQIAELRFFSATNCSEDFDVTRPAYNSDLTAEAISSGNTLGAESSRAFDGKTYTEWRAPCHICEPGEAWLGVRLNMPVKVLCVKIWQWGHGDYTASSFALQRWDPGSVTREAEWRDVLQADGLLGTKWDTVGFVTCDDLPPPEFGTVQITNNGYYPSEATFTCKGIRTLSGATSSSCNIDGTWSEEAPRCWAAIEFIGAGTAALFVEFLLFALYFRLVIMRKPAALKKDDFIPEDMLYKWQADLLHDYQEDGNAAAMCLCCPCCTIADTWHHAGLLHFQWGIWLPQFCCCCLPCIASRYRTAIRERVAIRTETTYTDILAWIFCSCCAAVQEAKHIDALCTVAHEEEESRLAAEQRAQEVEAKAIEAAKRLQEKQKVAGGGMKHDEKTVHKAGLSAAHGRLKLAKGSLESLHETAA